MSVPAEPYRPLFHFTARRNWINDPNGLVWFDGEYHLFFQYNPFGSTWGHMSWGHAVSPDLTTWTELAVAIPEDDRDMIFSGSVVVDHRDTGGFSKGGAPALVAVYTGDRQGEVKHQTQNLAYSHDRGRTWSKYAANPVLDIGQANFRDPKVFWHAPTARWVMIVALSDQEKISLYASPDLKAWSHLSDFGPAGGVGTLWECPDLFALPVEGEPGAEKWMLKVDLFKGGIGGGSSAQYFVGDFDGTRFTPDTDANGADLWDWADHGHDFYAAITWSNLPESDGRRLWIGWMSNHAYAANTPTSPWRGSMTVARALGLARRGGTWVLAQNPVENLRVLRGAALAATDIARTPLVFSPDARPVGLEITAVIGLGDAARCGLALTWSSGDAVLLGLDRARGGVFVDRARSGLMTGEAGFADPRAARVADLATRVVNLHVLLDAASIEVFADDGTGVITEQIFPRGGLDSVSWFDAGGTGMIKDLAVWPLQ